MTRAEVLWLKIIGVLLILVGIVLFASPTVTYTTREKVVNTGSLDVTAKRQKAVVIPRPCLGADHGRGLYRTCHRQTETAIRASIGFARNPQSPIGYLMTFLARFLPTLPGFSQSWCRHPRGFGHHHCRRLPAPRCRQSRQAGHTIPGFRPADQRSRLPIQPCYSLLR